jgi:hypothetical protein
MHCVEPGKALVAWKQPQYWDSRDAINDWASLAKRLERAQPQLDQLPALLREQRLGVQPDYGQVPFAFMPHLSRFRGMAQMLAAAVLLDLRAGRHESANDRLLALFELDLWLRRERLTPGQSVRLMVFTVAQTTLWEALQAPGWSEASLAQLQTACESPRFWEDCVASFETDRAMGNDLYRRLRTGESDLRGFWGPLPPSNFAGAIGLTALEQMLEGITDASAGGMQALLIALWKTGWCYQDQVFYNRSRQDLIDSFRQLTSRQVTVAQARARLAGSSFYRQRADLYSRATHLVSGYFLPWPEHLLDRCAEAETRRNLAVTALALARYRLRHKKLPASLSELVPTFLAAIPLDCFDGQPIRYRLESADSFLLYSVGLDAADDGGGRQTTSSPPRDARAWYGSKDIVWPEPVDSARSPQAGRGSGPNR